MKTLACFISLFVSFNAIAQKKDTLNSSFAPKVVFQECLDKRLNPDFYKGKFLILDFWATWCAPCIAGFPHFNELADKYSNDNVVFASYTVEPENIQAKFFKRTQKQLHALRLSDTSKLSRDSFHINFYPTCVIISPDNLIIWEGGTEQLNSDILDKVILKHQNMYKPQPLSPFDKPTITMVKKKKPLRTLLHFNITEADTDKKIEERFLGSVSLADGTIISYGMEKAQLKHVLQDLTGFSSTSRILTNDSSRLSKAYNLDYNVGSDTSRYKNYTNSILKSSALINFTLSTIGDVLKFNATVEKKRVKHYQLVITDTARLHTFKSMSGHQSFDDDHLPQIEYVGFSLKEQFIYFQYATKTIITLDGINDKNHYDLSINVADMDTFKKGLQFYGLALKEVNGDVELLSINFY